MTRWLLLAAAVLLNVALVLVALSPSVVTYAEIQPPGISCPSCSPDEFTAVKQAAAVGRAQVQSLVASNGWLLLGLAIANIVVVMVLVWMLRSNSTPHSDARASSALNQPSSARAGERGR